MGWEWRDLLGELLDAELLDAELLDAELLDAELLDAELLDAELLDAELLDADSLYTLRSMGGGHAFGSNSLRLVGGVLATVVVRVGVGGVRALASDKIGFATLVLEWLALSSLIME